MGPKSKVRFGKAPANGSQHDRTHSRNAEIAGFSGTPRSYQNPAGTILHGIVSGWLHLLQLSLKCERTNTRAGRRP